MRITNYNVPRTRKFFHITFLLFFLLFSGSSICSVSEEPKAGNKDKYYFINLIEQDFPNFASFSKLQKISIIRDWVYANTDIAVKELHIDQKQYPVWMLSARGNFWLHDQNFGGGWCTMIAHILMQVYQTLGYDSWRYDYGKKGTPMTHSTTLVEVDGRVFLQDAYFNLEYVMEDNETPEDFFTVLRKLKKFNTVYHKNGKNIYRDVHRLSDQPSLSWAMEDNTGVALRINDSHFVWKGRSSIESFVRRWKTMKEVNVFLQSENYPPEIQYLMMFPFAVYDQGYRENPKESKIFNDIWTTVCGSGKR